LILFSGITFLIIVQNIKYLWEPIGAGKLRSARCQTMRRYPQENIMKYKREILIFFSEGSTCTFFQLIRFYWIK
jgi:hypothetical protein